MSKGRVQSKPPSAIAAGGLRPTAAKATQTARFTQPPGGPQVYPAVGGRPLFQAPTGAFPRFGTPLPGQTGRGGPGRTRHIETGNTGPGRHGNAGGPKK